MRLLPGSSSKSFNSRSALDISTRIQVAAPPDLERELAECHAEVVLRSLHSPSPRTAENRIPTQRPSGAMSIRSSARVLANLLPRRQATADV